MYVPGCPPRPEQLIAAVMEMQAKVRRTGTVMGKEFMARDTPMGPEPFESEERYRIQDANLVQLGGFSAAMTQAGLNRGAGKNG
jgi:NADH-quinone oxidoreductase subunit B